MMIKIKISLWSLVTHVIVTFKVIHYNLAIYGLSNILIPRGKSWHRILLFKHLTLQKTKDSGGVSLAKHA